MCEKHEKKKFDALTQPPSRPFGCWPIHLSLVTRRSGGGTAVLYTGRPLQLAASPPLHKVPPLSWRQNARTKDGRPLVRTPVPSPERWSEQRLSQGPVR